MRLAGMDSRENCKNMRIAQYMALCLATGQMPRKGKAFRLNNLRFALFLGAPQPFVFGA